MRDEGVGYYCIAGVGIYDAPRFPETAPHYCVRANDECKWKRMGFGNVLQYGVLLSIKEE